MKNMGYIEIVLDEPLNGAQTRPKSGEPLELAVPDEPSVQPNKSAKIMGWSPYTVKHVLAP